MHKHEHDYLPAAGRDLFLPLYDPLTALLGLGRVRSKLLDQAELKPGQRILDLGCGTGSLLALLAKRAPNVAATGIDPDPKALRIAAKKLRSAYVRLDRGYAHALPYADATFDRVFSSFMYHHLEHDQQRAMLAEVRRVLAPNGRFELLDVEPDAGHRHSHGTAHEGRLVHNGPEQVLAALAGAGFDARVVNKTKWIFSMVFYQARARGSDARRA